MKIARGLEAFDHERALIVACGEWSAKLHFAHKGKIEYLGAVVVRAPKFSDREGFFMSSGRGLIFRTGSVREQQKEHRHQQFLHELMTQVERHAANLNTSTMYVICPEHTRPAVMRALEKHYAKQIRFVLPGCHVNDHPFTLIRRIEDARGEAFAVLHRPKREQEKKLLGRKVFGPRPVKLRK